MLENGLLILVIILILLTILLIIFCIPILIQIWRVSKDNDCYLADIESEFAVNIEKYGRDYRKCQQLHIVDE